MAYIFDQSKLTFKITNIVDYEFESGMWKEKVIMDAIRNTKHTNRWDSYESVSIFPK